MLITKETLNELTTQVEAAIKATEQQALRQQGMLVVLQHLLKQADAPAPAPAEPVTPDAEHTP